jgi:anti-sigma-K factor RskA
VEFEPENDFERELRQAMERRPAPPRLKRKVMDQRSRRQTQRLWSRTILWQRLAAALVLAAVLAGGVTWRNYESRREGEAAREQVLTALRITSHALNQVNTQLAATHRRADTE